MLLYDGLSLSSKITNAGFNSIDKISYKYQTGKKLITLPKHISDIQYNRK